MPSSWDRILFPNYPYIITYEGNLLERQFVVIESASQYVASLQSERPRYYSPETSSSRVISGRLRNRKGSRVVPTPGDTCMVKP